MSRHRCGGKLFHTRGPAALKLLSFWSPKLLCVCGTRHVLAAAEHSWWRSLSVTSWMSLAMYAGVLTSQRLVYQACNLVLNSLTDKQPMQLTQHQRDVVALSTVELLWPDVWRCSGWTELSAKGCLTCRTAWSCSSPDDSRRLLFLEAVVVIDRTAGHLLHIVQHGYVSCTDDHFRRSLSLFYFYSNFTIVLKSGTAFYKHSPATYTVSSGTLNPSISYHTLPPEKVVQFGRVCPIGSDASGSYHTASDDNGCAFLALLIFIFLFSPFSVSRSRRHKKYCQRFTLHGYIYYK